MNRLKAYLRIAIFIAPLAFLAPFAIAQDRSFVYTDRGFERPFVLLSICRTEKFEHNGELKFRAVSMETKKMMIATAKEMGFSTGQCGVPSRGMYDSMVNNLYMGVAVLHLTADEIEEFRKVNEETGRLRF